MLHILFSFKDFAREDAIDCRTTIDGKTKLQQQPNFITLGTR